MRWKQIPGGWKPRGRMERISRGNPRDGGEKGQVGENSGECGHQRGVRNKI